jgi:hypothetical protein
MPVTALAFEETARGTYNPSRATLHLADQALMKETSMSSDRKMPSSPAPRRAWAQPLSKHIAIVVTGWSRRHGRSGQLTDD